MSFVYWFIFLTILACIDILSNDKLLKTFVFYFVATIVLFFIGLGYKIGLDWPEYSRIYSPSPKNTENYEIAFLFLVKLLSPIMNFWFFVIFVKLLYLISILIIVKKYTKTPTFALVLIIGFLFTFINDPLRQLIATIIFYAFFIFKGKEGGVISIGVMSSFHSSSIIILTSKIKTLFQKKFVFIYIFFTLIFTFSLKNQIIIMLLNSILPSFIFKKLELYLTYAQSGNIFATLFRIVFFSYIVLSKKVNNSNSLYLHSNTYNIFWFFSLVTLLLEILALQFPLPAQRMRIYLIIFPIILFSNSIFYNKRYSIFLFSLFILLFLNFSIYFFSKGPIGNFYTLDHNIFIQYLLNFPQENWEDEVWEYWKYRTE